MAEQAKEAAHPSSLRVEVVTPRGPVVDAEADALTAPGRLGELEVFPGHVPFLTQLHPGVLVLGESKDRKVYAVSSGFLEIDQVGHIQVLVEKAVPADKVDLDAARAELDKLAPELRDWKGATDGEWLNLKARHDWARAQVDALERHS